ncbi:MAG TPA: HAD family phosphatase [Burkholderiales bacterium]|nr:HAD family phosphatase [Burkholderiales bacterium]
MTRPFQISALLFDLGGVLFNISFDRAFEAWQSISRLSADEMRRAFSFDEAYQRHERGEIARREYFDHLRQALHLTGSDAEIEDGWNAIFLDEIPSTIRLVQDTRAKLPCYAFSNSNATHRAFWMAKYPSVIAAFDRVFVSSDIGLRKPEAEAFAHVAASIGARPESILFFDDTHENVLGAMAAGLHAVHVRGPEDVEQAVQAIGRRPPVV